tara:strand:- start:668 stop:2179 length:1512 start_codon:yes stop_codon:yes gene_type:complete
MDNQILFGEWLPDQPEYNNPGVPYVSNVLPSVNGFKPMREITPITDAINARARGGIAAKDKSGVVYGYVGNETKLYSIGATAHTDVTNTGGAYALSSGENWEFARWGEKILAVCIDEPPQSITLAGANFADIAGSPPKARHIGVIGDFVVLGNIDDGTAKPGTVIWSGINDETDWTSSSVTQSDSQELRSNARNGGGEIMKISGGSEFGVIFQEYTIQRMVYEGLPRVFRFDEVLPQVGTPCKNSVVQEGNLIHFYGQDGFYQLSNGTELRKIGDQRVDKFFQADCDFNNPDRVIGAEDPRSSNVIWIYPSTSNGMPDKYIVYNWTSDKWASGTISVEWVYSSISSGYTLEGLDNINSSIDALGISLDSPDLKGGQLQFAVYDSNNKFGIFSGAIKNGEVETTYFKLNPSGNTVVTGVRPLVTGADPSVTVTSKQNLNSPDENASAVRSGSQNATTGILPFRSNGQYHKFKVTTQDFTNPDATDVDYNDLLGIFVEFNPTGGR